MRKPLEREIKKREEEMVKKASGRIQTRIKTYIVGTWTSYALST